MEEIIARIELRCDSAANWENANPILVKGEPGIIIGGADHGKMKVGDGVNAWKQLQFTTKDGTFIFPVTGNTPAAPAGSRENDLILNSGTSSYTIGGVVVAAGGLARIAAISPLTCTVVGNVRGPQGSAGPTGPAGPAISEIALMPIPGSNEFKIVILGYDALLGKTNDIKFGPRFEGSIIIGAEALKNSHSGSYESKHSVYIGRAAGMQSNGGDFNVVVGAEAFKEGARGQRNIYIGYRAGDRAQGDQNVLIGGSNGYTYFSRPLQNCGAFGYGAETLITSPSNFIRIGNDQQNIYMANGVQVISDERDKADITDISLGLNFIESLRPVDYKWDYRSDYIERGYDEETGFAYEDTKERDGTKKRKRSHHGFIAQEVSSIIKETGKDFGGFQDHAINSGSDTMSLNYEEFIAPMVKAIQELSAQNKILEKRIIELEAKK